MLPDTDFYQMITKINAQRKQSQIWNDEQVERYVDDNFFSFSRGKFLVALTNSGNTQQRKVTYHPFSEGETVCNIFYPTTDCQQVSGGVDVYLLNGESKIYVPQGDLAEAVLDLETFADEFKASDDVEVLTE